MGIAEYKIKNFEALVGAALAAAPFKNAFILIEKTIYNTCEKCFVRGIRAAARATPTSARCQDFISNS